MYDIIVSTSSKHGNSESLTACTYSFCLQKAVQQQLLINVWLLCMMNLLQLFYSNQLALNKFTPGHKYPEGYSCSSRPSDATNQVQAAAIESWFWKTEE